MKEHWHPSIKLGDIIEKTSNFVERYMVPIDKVSGKIIKRVHGNDSLIKLFTTVFIIKLVFSIIQSFILKTIQSNKSQTILDEIYKLANQTVESTYLPTNSDSVGSNLPPLHLYLTLALGYIIKLFPQGYHIIVLSIIDTLTEPLFLFLPLSLLSNTLNAPHFHKTIRHSLITLAIL